MSTTIDTQTTLPVGTWHIDPVHSQVSFAVGYHVGTFRGSFSPVQAELVVGEDGNATLTGSTAVGAVKVQDENLTGHLQSPEFFDAERTPEISFVSSAIRPAGDRLEIEGDLTIKGTTVPVKATGQGRRAEGLHGPAILRARARDGHRPHAVRSELEQPTAERRAGARERRHDRG